MKTVKREGGSDPAFKIKCSEVQVLLLWQRRSYEKGLSEAEKGFERWEAINSQSCKGSSLFDGGDVFLATAESSGKSDWILDSGCSFYMCSLKERFDTYKSYEKGTVNMANSTRSQVAKMRTIQICMFDRIVWKVTGVRHVPRLKRNLISLGTLDAKGYYYLF